MPDWFLPVLATGAITAIFTSIGFAFTTSRQLAILATKFDKHEERDDDRKAAQQRLCDERHGEVDRRLDNLERTRSADYRIRAEV